jgi:hypothetical protein
MKLQKRSAGITKLPGRHLSYLKFKFLAEALRMGLRPDVTIVIKLHCAFMLSAMVGSSVQRS